VNYIRFTTFLLDPNSGRPLGLFQLLGIMEDAGVMQDYEISWMNDVLQWFNKNLKEPSTFSRSKKTHAKQVGLCWYKSTANEHINKMYELVELLRHHNIEVNILKTNKPGYIVFEDEYQTVAEPFVEN
jgi:DUF2075 family protein